MIVGLVVVFFKMYLRDPSTPAGVATVEQMNLPTNRVADKMVCSVLFGPPIFSARIRGPPHLLPVLSHLIVLSQRNMFVWSGPTLTPACDFFTSSRGQTRELGDSFWQVCE